MERKPRARRQAQVEEFAHARVKEFSPEQALFLKYSDELSRNVVKDPEQIPEEYPDELKRAIQNYWEVYVHFLQNLKAEDKLAIQLAEQNAKLYEEKFSGPVKRLRAALKRGEEIDGGESAPVFLGNGSNGAAYLLPIDGHEYVVKIGGSATQANFELRALIRAKGIPKVAQVVAYSFEDQAVVMERAPGKDVTHLSEAVLGQVTKDQIVELVRTVQALAEHGLVIDPKPSNFMYDQEQGFTVLDYHVAHRRSSRMAEQVMSLRHALSGRLDPFKYPEREDPEGDFKIDQHTLEQQRFSLPRMMLLVNVLRENFPDVIESWKAFRTELRKDQHRGGGEFLRKDYYRTDQPDIAEYIRQLEELDDGWIFF